MKHHTMFGDLRARASSVVRVKTQGSVYLIGFHELRGRKYVIVRGAPGTDREHVVVRDSDPRVGDHSMFELPTEQWPGRELEVATMTSSTIVSVAPETDVAAIAAVSGDAKASAVVVPGGNATGWAPRPPGMPEAPCIAPGSARGTMPAAASVAMPAQGVAHQVVVGQPPAGAPPELAYPQRQVAYAENVAALLRSIARRDRLFEDLDPGLRSRLRAVLDESVMLLEMIRRRDRS